jgi:hypothetical protein
MYRGENENFSKGKKALILKKEAISYHRNEIIRIITGVRKLLAQSLRLIFSQPISFFAFNLILN